MKTLCIILVLAIFGFIGSTIFISCSTSNPVYTGPQRIMESPQIDEYEYKGHHYLVLKSYSDSIIHAEHCPCKSAWLTNAALNNLFLQSMLGTNAP